MTLRGDWFGLRWTPIDGLGNGTIAGEWSHRLPQTNNQRANTCRRDKDNQPTTAMAMAYENQGLS